MLGLVKNKKFQQGIFNPVHKEKYKGDHFPIYRSSFELHFFKFCDNNPNVLSWQSESIVIPYIHPLLHVKRNYFVDGSMQIKERDKIKKYLVEIKPFSQTKEPSNLGKKGGTRKQSTIIYEQTQWVVNQVKWNAAKVWAKEHGMEFIILTEKELNIH